VVLLFFFYNSKNVDSYIIAPVKNLYLLPVANNKTRLFAYLYLPLLFIFKKKVMSR